MKNKQKYFRFSIQKLLTNILILLFGYRTFQVWKIENDRKMFCKYQPTPPIEA